MLPYELSGTYTYRSFINEPNVVGDFGKLEFAEAELTLFAALDGALNGVLSWPTSEDDATRAFMDVSGQVATRDPLLVRLDGVGRKGSATADFAYTYELTLARRWPETSAPRSCLVGSVMRAQDHGTKKAGFTASVVAIRRDFVEPRDIPGVALAPTVVTMLSSKWHRLWHATWHTARGAWPDLEDPATGLEIAKLGWAVERPPRKKKDQGRNLILENGAGEDFLFMHRWMIGMVRADYAANGIAPPSPWKPLPPARVAQVVYVPSENEDGTIEFKKDLSASGNMVPLTDEWAKTQEYFGTVLRQWESLFTSPSTLASLSLGALGNLLEFTIHNAMHNRWATPPRDPDTGEAILDPVTGGPAARPDFDFSDKWNSPRYDYLGEFYSSHVNPLFWRLHGWVDDRIDDWFAAQEASSPGRIGRRTLRGVQWFEVKPPLVMVADPFVGISLEGHVHRGAEGLHPKPAGGDAQASEIETMLMVMALIENDGKGAAMTSALAEPAARKRPFSMRFEMPGEEVE